jgi:hypothetical protein
MSFIYMFGDDWRLDRAASIIIITPVVVITRFSAAPV